MTRRSARIAALLYALLATSPVAGALPHTARLLVEPPSTVLARYEAALNRLATPKFVRFEYAVEQVGLRNLAQTHRVYRSGVDERDEMLSVDGQLLATPAIRIVRNRRDRYDVRFLAPRERDYTFSYVGAHRDGPHVDYYLFKTTPRDPSATYRVEGIAIGSAHFLPRTIAYVTTLGGVTGHGTLTYWKQDKYWIVSEATATAKIGGKVARERLVFHNYDFPPLLPKSTFSEPRAATTSPP